MSNDSPMIRVMEFKAEYVGKKEIDWVLIGPMGEAIERTQTWRRVDKIRPPENPDRNMLESTSYVDMKAKWEQIEPHYTAWKTGNAVPETGTPLGAWSGVTQPQSEILKGMGFVTVESVTKMTESDIAKLPFPGARAIPNLAKEYLEGKDVADLQAQNLAMSEKLAKLEAAVNGEKPRRGRPPKKPVETAL